jgi:hypothetical protein
LVPDALHKDAVGHRLIARTAWFHYSLGATIDQFVSILAPHPAALSASKTLRHPTVNSDAQPLTTDRQPLYS